MSMLSLYKLLFMTELLLAEGLASFRLKKRRYFALRCIAAVIICYAVALLFPLPARIAYTWWYTSLMFVIMFGVTLAALLFTFKISVSTAVFCAITAYTVQHFAYESFSLIYNVSGLEGGFDMYSGSAFDLQNFTTGTLISILIYLDVYVLAYGIAFYLLGLRFKSFENGELHLKKFYMIFTSSLLLLIDVILNAVAVYIIEGYNNTYTIIVGIYNVLCCILVLYMQINMIEVSDMKEEMEMASRLLRQSQKQYELQRENLKFINVKIHDMRHQMLRFANSGKLDEEEVAEMNRAVSVYDAAVKTGNEALDVILTEKSLVCVGKDIRLTCLIECNRIEFMREGDLYALFGNMLDNAIDAASEIQDKDKRCVSLNVRNVGNMISISTENYFVGDLNFGADGLPRTKKSADEGHGFGMLSIKGVVNKYGGTVSVVTNGNIFRINILIPCKGAKNVDGGTMI